jgi:hypothetical protein
LNIEFGIRLLSQRPGQTYIDYSTDYLRGDFSQIISSLRLAEMGNERASTLAEKLSATSSEKQAIKQEKKDIEGLKRQALAVQSNTQVPYAQQHMEASRVASAALAMSASSDKLSSEIVKKAEEESEKLESQYRLWTWVSYALYVLGVAAALAGKLLGDDDLVPGL